MANILSVGITDAQSADFTLAAGDATTLHLISSGSAPTIPVGADMAIQVKGSDGIYYTVGTLDASVPAKVLASPGTFRIARFAGRAAAGLGVDRD